MSSCIVCPSQPEPCSCSSGQICQQVAMTCNSCAYNRCLDDQGEVTSSSGGLNGGVVGGVAAALTVGLILLLVFVFWRRRTSASRKMDRRPSGLQRASSVQKKPLWLGTEASMYPEVYIPAAKTGSRQYNVSSKSDGKSASLQKNSNYPSLSPQQINPTTRVFSDDQTAINLNPFTDDASVISQTGSDASTRIIEITDMNDHPLRPPRAPGLVSLRSNPVQPVYSNLSPPTLATRQSTMSAFSSLSNSSFLDIPTIVTPAVGGVRKVQLDRAEVIRLGGTSSPELKPSSPNTVSEKSKLSLDPFKDKHETEHVQQTRSAGISRYLPSSPVSNHALPPKLPSTPSLAAPNSPAYTLTASPSLTATHAFPTAPSLRSMGSPALSKIDRRHMSHASSLGGYAFETPRTRNFSTFSTSSSLNGLGEFEFAIEASSFPLPEQDANKAANFPLDVDAPNY